MVTHLPTPPMQPAAIGSVPKFQRAREMQAARGREKLAGSKHPDDIKERRMDPVGEAAARDEMMEAAKVLSEAAYMWWWI